MQTESTSKYYYRYQVLSEDDLSEETIARRLKKIRQANACTVLFDLTSNKDSVLTKKLANHFSFFSAFKIEFLIAPGHLATMADLQLDPHPSLHIQITNSASLRRLDSDLVSNGFYQELVHIHLSPRTQADLNSFKNIDFKFDRPFLQYFWDFRPYDSNVKNSLTAFDIGRFLNSKDCSAIAKHFSKGKISGLEIWNDQVPAHYELESESNIQWQFETKTKDLKLSVVIPTFNNGKFLSNVVHHLLHQTISPEKYEIVIVEDGGTDHTSETIQALFESYRNKVNLKFIYWSKSHPTKGSQNFFRAGLARNLGVRFTEAETLFFLDSDMLVPKDFVTTCIEQLTQNDVIQFQRHHIHQALSQQNPTYQNIQIAKDTYIEEKSYWSQLFQSDNWQGLSQYWKFTCTYALGIKKTDFIKMGRFKKYYVSYGFEDTDLGYEMHKRNKTFKLVKIPLLHLTAYDQMQYRNSQTKRMQLLRKTSALFFLQHLDDQIFSTFENFYRFEKPIKNRIKDLF